MPRLTTFAKRLTRAAERYVSQIQPLTGNIELIVAGRRLADDPLQTPDCGWSNHVSSVRVHVLDADHLGLVEEPGVASLAEVFLEGLHRSDNQRPSREHDDGQAPPAVFRRFWQPLGSINLERTVE